MQVWKGFMAPTGRQYGRDRIDLALLCLSVIVALAALGIAVRPHRVGLSGGVERGVGEYVGEQIRAAQIMADCISAVSDARAELGIPIDPELDPNRTGLIGRDFTPLTTTVGGA